MRAFSLLVLLFFFSICNSFGLLLRSRFSSVAKRSALVTVAVAPPDDKEAAAVDTNQVVAAVDDNAPCSSSATSTRSIILEGLKAQAARVTVSVAVLAIALVSPFTIDGEGAVAKRIPTGVSNFVRDRRETWSTFNSWTWILTAPAVALTRPRLLLQLLPTLHEERNLPFYDDDAPSYPAGSSSSSLGGGTNDSPAPTLDVFHHGDTGETNSANGDANGVGSSRPVVVFIHGGAWSQGSKQLFSLFARRLRDDSGFVTVVPGYRRYPDANSRGQACDVGASLSWVGRHISRFGGDPQRVILLGHSSGAHISALHLLGGVGGGDVMSGGDDECAGGSAVTTTVTTTATMSTATASSSSSSSSDSDGCGAGGGGGEGDLGSVERSSSSNAVGAVHAFVGLCGVYDISAHYEHERRRGVHEISALKPANGGGNVARLSGNDADDASSALFAAFEAHSPTAILAKKNGGGGSGAGFTRDEKSKNGGESDARKVVLPPVLLFHATDDTIVPLRSSRDFLTALQAAHPEAQASLDILNPAGSATTATTATATRDTALGDVDRVKKRSAGSQDEEEEGGSGGHGGVLLDIIMGKPNARLISLLQDALAAVDSGGQKTARAKGLTRL